MEIQYQHVHFNPTEAVVIRPIISINKLDLIAREVGDLKATSSPLNYTSSSWCSTRTSETYLIWRQHTSYIEPSGPGKAVVSHLESSSAQINVSGRWYLAWLFLSHSLVSQTDRNKPLSARAPFLTFENWVYWVFPHASFWWLCLHQACWIIKTPDSDLESTQRQLLHCWPDFSEIDLYFTPITAS